MCNSHKNEKLYEIKKRVLIENKKLVNNGLVIQSFGNASQRFEGQLIIKPSGIDLKKAIPEDMVVVDLVGEEYEGDKKPSSDTPTLIELYKAFPKVGGIVLVTHFMLQPELCQKNQYPFGNNACRLLNEVLLTKVAKKEINGEYEKEKEK